MDKNGRLLLQSDWADALKLEDREIWAGFQYNEGKESDYTVLGVERNENGCCLTSSEKTFQAQLSPMGTLELVYKQQDKKYSTNFVYPFAVFHQIHNANTMIQSMDVCSGGTGMSTDGDKVVLWNPVNGAVLGCLEGHKADVSVCRFFPSGRVALTGGDDMQLKIWAVDTGECPRTLIGHTQGITDVGMLNLGKNILSCSRDGSVKVWDCGTVANLMTLKPEVGELNQMYVCQSNSHLINSSPVEIDRHEAETQTEGKAVIVASGLGFVIGYCLYSRTKTFEFKTKGSGVTAISMWKTENECLFGCEDGSVHVLDLRNTKDELFQWKTKRGKVHSVHVEKNGGTYLSFGDGTVSYWREDGKSVELSCSDCEAVCDIKSDGSFIFTASRDGKIN